MQAPAYDVVVIGAGNAAMSAALAARDEGARVLVMERAPEQARGGNSYFSGGLVRFAFAGLEDIRTLIPDLSESELASVEVGSYSAAQFFETLAASTEYLADPELVKVVTGESLPTMQWLHSKGVRFGFSMRRQAYQSGQRTRFGGNTPVEFVGGGTGLIDGLFAAAEREGVEIWYGARATKLLLGEEDRIRGVQVRRNGRSLDVAASALVIACGGFEANPELRARYLGPDWDLAKVRGTEYNTGDGIAMAMAVGAQPYGHWSGCHAVPWDQNAPATGDRKVGDLFSKYSYPLGIMVNRQGKRFLDEGADFRSFTYARYGREILRQPGRMAAQIFDGKLVPLLREEYRIRQASKVTANTLEELAIGLEVDPQGLAATVREFNAAIQDGEFNANELDGKRTAGITPPKSNWAVPIDTPPYVGFGVTCGITFTFGGLRVNARAQVLDTENQPIAGLFAAGELVGGLFYYNYPGGAGLTAGAVLGRAAGRGAAWAAVR